MLIRKLDTTEQKEKSLNLKTRQKKLSKLKPKGEWGEDAEKKQNKIKHFV